MYHDIVFVKDDHECYSEPSDKMSGGFFRLPSTNDCTKFVQKRIPTLY